MERKSTKILWEDLKLDEQILFLHMANELISRGYIIGETDKIAKKIYESRE